MLSRILSLVRKELHAVLSDRESRQLLIVPVLLQLLLFPFAATLEVRNNTLAVFNQDTGPGSVELIQRFARAGAFTRFLMLHSEHEVAEVLDGQKALLVLEFPMDFSRAAVSGQAATLQAILDGRRSNSGQVALGYVQTIVQDYANEQASAHGRAPLSQIVVRHWFNANLNYRWLIVPSLIMLISTIGGIIVSALSVAREREEGTFEQLLVSPLSPGMIMLGKSIPSLVIALSQATIVLAAAVFVFRIPFQGSLLLLYACTILFVISLSGIGLLVSSVCATQQQAFLGVFSFVMPSTLLSGFFSPVENMPRWLQTLTWVNPLRHFIAIVRGIFLRDLPMGAVWHEAWPLLIICTASMGAAWWMFHRKIA